MVATALTEHSYWLALIALAFLAVFVYATHATQEIAFEWKPGLSALSILETADYWQSSSECR